jgi:paraquat-inducible protein A
LRGIEADILSCPNCHELIKSEESVNSIAICPRCGEEVSIRKIDSLQNTFALVIASIIFYIPANMLPMMRVETFAGASADTIISGVIYFIETGSYLIAFVIFVASIIVPIAKIIILLYLLYSAKYHTHLTKKQKTKLYRLTELIGRWSMVDVYVVGIMVALVHFGGLSEIKADMGANFFLIVVVLTMLAAHEFDPRLIWDKEE